MRPLQPAEGRHQWNRFGVPDVPTWAAEGQLAEVSTTARHSMPTLF